jgi:sterol desaturase/sphingolipid hydroxylase (fatty acid hydroxylase superfamily)
LDEGGAVVSILVVLVLGLLALDEARKHARRSAEWEDFGWMVVHVMIAPVWFTLSDPFGAGGWWAFVAFVVLFEFAFWAVHRLGHTHAWDWHRLHHDQPEIGQTTTWRAHGVERLAFAGVAWCAAWLTGVSAGGFLAYMLVALGAQVHAHARAPFNGAWIERLGLVSPRLHRAHHWEGARWNYGHATWFPDWLTGTLLVPATGRERNIGGSDVEPEERARAWALCQTRRKHGPLMGGRPSVRQP